MQENSLVVMIHFDAQTNEHIHQLKVTACEKQSTCDLFPIHLSIGLYSGIHEAELVAWTKKFAKNHKPFSITFDKIGMFGDRVCYLAPQMSTDLLIFYSDYHQKYDDFASESGQYYSLKNGKWVPHCTLFMSDTESIKPAFSAVEQIFIPFSGTVESISVGQDNPVKNIAHFPL